MKYLDLNLKTTRGSGRLSAKEDNVWISFNFNPPTGGLGNRQEGEWVTFPRLVAVVFCATVALYVILPLLSLSMSHVWYQPMGFTGNVGVYKSVHLMVSLGSRHQNYLIVLVACQGTHHWWKGEAGSEPSYVFRVGVLIVPRPPWNHGVGCIGITVHGHGMGLGVNSHQCRGTLGSFM